MRRGSGRSEAGSSWREHRAMGRDVVKLVGALLAIVGTAAFVYGLIVLVSNGNCGCSDDGFCSGPPCPPADDLGFLGLFAGIWVAVGGIIMMSVAAARAKTAKWRAQYASGAGAFTGSRLATPAGTPGASGLTLAAMGGSFGATSGMTMAPGANPAMFDPKALNDLAAQLSAARQANSGNPDAARQATLDVLRGHGYQIPANVPPGPVVLQMGTSPSVISSGPGFALPGAQGPAPGSAEAILAADAQAGLPTAQPAQGDATGRLQELDALKAQGVVNDAEYAAQRQRILDSI
jgi:hypothetical protein